MSTVIASRKFEDSDGHEIVARVFLPHRRVGPSPGWGETWRCSMDIKFGKRKKVFTIVGEDSMQAIILAFQRIRLELERHPKRVRFNHFEWGETAIGKPITFSYGVAFRRRLERLVEREESKQVRQNWAERQK